MSYPSINFILIFNRFVHAVGTLKTKAHDKAINSIAFHSPTTSLISGSSGENALKVG